MAMNRKLWLVAVLLLTSFNLAEAQQVKESPTARVSIAGAGYDKKNMAVDIHELTASLGLDRVSIVGHDIGLR